MVDDNDPGAIDEVGKCMAQDGCAVEVQKLLGRLTGDARTYSGGEDDSDGVVRRRRGVGERPRSGDMRTMSAWVR